MIDAKSENLNTKRKLDTYCISIPNKNPFTSLHDERELGERGIYLFPALFE